MRACIYVRLSVLRERDPSLSPASQEEACRFYADSQGWEVVRVIQDLDQSAYRHGERLNRPGLREAIQMCTSGEADVILSKRPDRFARSAADGIELSQMPGVRLATPGSGLIGASAFEQFQSGLGFLLSELESAQLAERQIDSIDKRRREGRWTTDIPYGFRSYRGDDNGAYLEADPDQKRIVVEAAKRMVEGESANAIARDLNKRSVPTRRGHGNWTATTIKRILRNPLVCHGWSMHNGALVRDADGNPLVIVQPLLRPSVVSKLSQMSWFTPTRGERVTPGRKHKYPLGRYLRCTTCGGRMVVNHRRGKDRYRCNNPTVCDYMVSINRDLVDGLFDDWIAALSDADVVTQTVLLDTTEDAARERAAAEAVVDDLLNQMALPGADVPALAAELIPAKEKAEAVQKGSVTHRVVRSKVPIRGVWPELDDDERRNFLRPWLHSVSIYPRGTDPRIRVNRQADIDYWVTANSDEELNAD